MYRYPRIFALLVLAFGFGACQKSSTPGDGGGAANRAPTLTSIAPLSGATGDTSFAVTYEVLAAAADEADPDGDAISFRLESVATGTVTKTGAAALAGQTLLTAGEQWDWAPPAGARGDLAAFTVRALDAAGLSSSLAVPVTIAVAPGSNHPPTLAKVGLLAGGRVDVPVTITPAALLAASDAADLDGDPLVFRLAALASGTLTAGGAAVSAGSLLGANAAWTWKPPAGATGALSAFTVTVFDGAADSSPAVQIQVNVRQPNRAPVFTTVALIDGAKQAAPFTLTYARLAAAANATDPDGDPLTFRLEQLQAGTLVQSKQPAIAGSATLTAGGAPFVWTPDTLGDLAAFTLSVSDGALATGPVQVTIRVTLGHLSAEWTGGYTVAAGWTTTGTPSPGAGDGMFNYPGDVLAVGTYLYVADGNGRIVKLDAASGSTVGWVGVVDLPPTGGTAGCAGAARDAITPGWCTGGTARGTFLSGGLVGPKRLALSGTTLYVSAYNGIGKYDTATGAYLGGSAAAGPSAGIAVDATYVYITDAAGARVVRFKLSDLTQTGWLGRVATVPSSCTSTLPSAHTFSGSWCTGGTSEAGTGAGELTQPFGIAAFGGKLYVASQNGVRRYDATTGASESYAATSACTGIAIDGSKLYATTWYQIFKHDLASGALEGWIGRVGSSPPTSCLGALPAAYELTGSWCLDGTSYAFSYTDTRVGAFTEAQGLSTGGGALYFVDPQNGRIQKLDLALGSPIAWIGARALPLGAWTAQDTPGAGSGMSDGVFDDPRSVAFDASDDLLYVASDYRISKLRASTGEFLGWTGRTTTMPSSCAEQMPAVVPAATNGWCKGGTPAPGSGAGELWYPMRVSLANGYLYVADTVVKRFTKQGTFAGWIGNIASTVGISPAACAQAGVGSFSPDWCFGGAALVSPSADFYAPWDISVRGNTMILADWRLKRASKIDMTPGAMRFIGWTGRVGPTAGSVPSACVSGTLPLVNAATGGWCTGGTAADGNGDGMFTYVQAVAQDPSGNVYVMSGDRVSMLDAGGAFVGWIGRISGTVVGGSCDGATVFTPHWCQGGVSTPGFSLSPALAYDENEDVLYIGNTSQLVKVDGLSGANLGWAGEVGWVPTGGGPGCTTSVVGELTPSWCVGGGSEGSTRHASLNAEALGVGVDYLYIGDAALNRVLRLSKHEQ